MTAIAGQSATHATQYLVCCVAVEPASAQVLLCLVVHSVHGRPSFLGGFLGCVHEVFSERALCTVVPFSVYFFGVAYLLDDMPYGIDVHGLVALLFAFPQQFGHTVLYVVCHFFFSFSLLEVAVHALQVFVQCLVRVLIDVVQFSVEID